MTKLFHPTDHLASLNYLINFKAYELIHYEKTLSFCEFIHFHFVSFVSSFFTNAKFFL